MEQITKEQARSKIQKLGLPPIVLDVFDERPLPYSLKIQFQSPEHIFALDADGQKRYQVGNVIPLWTNTSGYCFFAYANGSNEDGYFRFDIETAESYEPTGMTWQQVLVREFKELWESERPEKQLREISGLFEFRHTDAILAELSSDGEKLDTFEKSERWHRDFLEKIKV